MRFLTAAVLALCAGLAACSPPPPGVHEVLKISAQGEYTLNGVPVAKDQLHATLVAEQARVKDLFAEIVASPEAEMSAITFALDTLKSVNARIAFIDEAIMKGNAASTP